MERRKLLWQGLCALPLAWTPLGRARGDGVTVCGDRDFYRVLEDARMSNCWREYRDAYDLYQRALKLLPVNADSSLLAEILEDQKSLRRIFREAGDSLPRHLAAVKAAPESSEQRFWLAHTLHRMGRTAEASEQFQAVLSLPESDWRTGSWLALGWIHYRQGHYAEAIPYLDRVLGVETEKNRLHAASTAQALPGVIRQDLKRSIAFRERAAERLTRQAMKLIAADRLLQERFEALDSIPGVAQTSAIPHPGGTGPALARSGREAVGGLRRPRSPRTLLRTFGVQKGAHLQDRQPSSAPRSVYAGPGCGATRPLSARFLRASVG